MTAIAKTNQNIPALAMPEQELLSILGSSLYPGASQGSIKMVLSYCKAGGLDPMQKPVHIVPMWDRASGSMRDVVMPGIGLYRTQAARSGQLAGISEPEFGPEQDQNIGGQQCRFPEWCRVTVRRELSSGKVADFTAVEYWVENYAVKGGKEKSIAPNAMWTKRPRGQLAKCAQAQALRMAFPEVGAAPTADEMEGKAIDAEGVEINTSAPQSRANPAMLPYPPEQFGKNFAAWEALIKAGKKSPQQIISMVQTKGLLSEDQMQALRDCEITDAEIAE